jgi:hypothetical protein
MDHQWSGLSAGRVGISDVHVGAAVGRILGCVTSQYRIRAKTAQMAKRRMSPGGSIPEVVVRSGVVRSGVVRSGVVAWASTGARANRWRMRTARASPIGHRPVFL